MNVSIGKIQKALSPNPFALVTSTKEDGSTNAMALSWWCYASNNPPKVLICTSNKGYTGACIRRTGEFGLCFPTEEIKDGAFYCGTCSGRDIDKLATVGLETEEPAVIGTKLLKHCKAALECRLWGQPPLVITRFTSARWYRPIWRRIATHSMPAMDTDSSVR